MTHAKPDKKDTKAPRRIRLLIVEDSERDCVLLTQELRRSGFDPDFLRVETAVALDEALSKQKWDLIVSDYTMPRFSAPAALEMVKKGQHDIPFLVVSGSVGEDIAVRMMKAGASDYIMKGQLNRLVPAIEREIREAERRREKRRVEQELNKSQQWLSAVIEASRDGIAVFDSGQFLFANPAFARLYGVRSPSELIGQEIGKVMGNEAQQQFETWQRQRDRGVSPPTLTEFRSLEKDGHWLELEASLSFTTIADKSFLMVVVRDIRDRRRLEEQLRQSQKMDAIGKLASGVAHDFNNLLTAITGYSQLALQNLKPDHPLRAELGEIQKAADKAASLTHQLLAFSRKQPVTQRIINLNTTVLDMQRMLTRIIGSHIDLRTFLGESLGQVKADPDQIGQVILNLIVNARDAMPNGGKLTIETTNVDFDEEAALHHGRLQPGPWVLLSVSDSGCGMDSETQSHVFEPFFTTKEPGKGTGIGLSTVYAIVEQSGGGIWVYSEPNRGTTFKIYLPRVDGESERRTPGPLPEADSEVFETVLLVEDDEMVRHLMRQVLARRGYTVFEARQSAEAIEACRTQQGVIHLLVTDMVMPGLNGWELAQRVVELRPEIKTLFVSGYAEAALIHQGIQDNTVNFLQKPFSPAAFASKVRAILDTKANSVS
jgi:PAS domain S-box-containing protein